MNEEQINNKWTKITRGNKITKKVAPYYVHLSHAYAQFEEFSEDLSPTPPEHKTSTTINTNDCTKHQSKFKLKAERRLQTKFTKYMNKMKDEGIIDLYITKAKDERTAIAKQDLNDARRITIDRAHAASHQAKAKPQLIQQGKNIVYVLATTVRKLVHKFTNNNQKVRFRRKPTVTRFHNKEDPIIITYDSGADNHYMSEADRMRLKLPILQPSHKRVSVANGGTSKGKYVTHLHFSKLSTTTAEVDTFEDFP